MAADQTRFLVDMIGAVLQVAGAVLMLVLMVLLHRRRRAPHSGRWTAAWLLLSVAVLAVSARVLIIPLTSGVVLDSGHIAVRLLVAVYQLAKIGALLLFLHGSLSYAGRPLARGWIVAVALLAVGGAGAALAGRPMDELVRLQAPLAALALGLSAMVLLRLPADRRGVGTRVTGLSFAAGALLWTVYGAVSHSAPMAMDSALHILLGSIVRYNRFADFFFTTALGLGMVVLLLEDALGELAAAKHRVDAANVELAAAHDRLRRVATSDALTGCLNRQGLQEWLDARPATAAERGAVLVLDMDNLKPVNDAFGHGAGDAMLRQLAAVLRGVAGPAGALCRWGGDEFLLVLPGLSPVDAEANCRRALAEAPSLAIAGSPEVLTVEASVGAAAYDGADDVPAAIRRADSGMYRHKQTRKLQSGSWPATLG
ncbi:MAG: GGDEF domain-containing protein [Gemmatimonadaceae bacterium]